MKRRYLALLLCLLLLAAVSVMSACRHEEFNPLSTNPTPESSDRVPNPLEVYFFEDPSSGASGWQKYPHDRTAETDANTDADTPAVGEEEPSA